MRVKTLVKDYAGCAAGATSIEYALIAGSISIVIVAVVAAIGTEVAGMFTAVADGF